MVACILFSLQRQPRDEILFQNWVNIIPLQHYSNHPLQHYFNRQLKNYFNHPKVNNISTTHGNIIPTNHCNIISANHFNIISTKLTLTTRCYAFVKIWSKLFKLESESDNFREHCSNYPLVLSRISWTHKIFPNDFPIKRNMYAKTGVFLLLLWEIYSLRSF